MSLTHIGFSSSVLDRASDHRDYASAMPIVARSRSDPARRGSIDTRMALRHSGEQDVHIRWECVGPADAPLLLVQGGISANRHVLSSATFEADGWWQAQSGKAFDTKKYRVLAIDWLGADGLLDVCIDPVDQANALVLVLDALDVRQAEAYIGASYGAMVGLQFAALHGTRLRKLIAISGAHRAHPQVTALRVIQRRIVQLGVDNNASQDGLALARALAVIGYRTDDEFAQRFDAPYQIKDGHPCFAVESYLDAVGTKFTARFGTTAYLRLSESIDLQRLTPRSVHVPTTLVGVRQDQVVPLCDLQALADGISGRCRLHTIDSLYGHDAFLKEASTITQILKQALNEELGA